MLDTDRELTVVPAEEAAAPVSSAPVPVKVGPDKANTVYLAPTLTMEMGMALASALGGEPTDVVEVEAMLMNVTFRPAPTGAFLGWDFRENDEPVPLTRENIARLIPWDQGGLAVANVANDLYMGIYLRPFLQAEPTRSSPPMPTDHLTSRRNGSGPKRAKESKRSSRNGTAGKP